LPTGSHGYPLRPNALQRPPDCSGSSIPSPSMCSARSTRLPVVKSGLPSRSSVYVKP
jgi:hypothetical protein